MKYNFRTVRPILLFILTATLSICLMNDFANAENDAKVMPGTAGYPLSGDSGSVAYSWEGYISNKSSSGVWVVLPVVRDLVHKRLNKAVVRLQRSTEKESVCYFDYRNFSGASGRFIKGSLNKDLFLGYDKIEFGRVDTVGPSNFYRDGSYNISCFLSAKNDKIHSYYWSEED